LVNAQGEDVVAGIRTPLEITHEGSLRWAKLQGITEEMRLASFQSLEEVMPKVYKELHKIQRKLENHYRDMQDIEFTIQDGKLWLLQTRNGKRTGTAMVKIAMDLHRENKLSKSEALLKIEPNKLNELLHPVFEKAALKKGKVIAKGLPASPGAATGQIVFNAEEAQNWANEGRKLSSFVSKLRRKTLAVWMLAEGILTARGGMTSHAAVVARGMGKCCVSGAGGIKINYKNRTLNSRRHFAERRRLDFAQRFYRRSI
jgi:pyruvate, orthophosphate dikinase